MGKQYRNLTQEEIARMCAAGCACEEWGRVKVSDGFDAGRIVRTSLYGDIRIGACGGGVSDIDGVERPAGIYDSSLSDCTVGDGACISRVGIIARYDIGDGAVVEDTARVVCNGSSFGNGVRVKAVNEGGGREVAIYDGLTAQTAYIMAMYRHLPDTVSRMEGLVEEYVSGVRSDRGTIGCGAVVSGCGVLRDVRVGDYAVVEGADKLRNGTLAGSREHPVRIGAAVSARDFIVSRGASIVRGVILERCFVGEACRLENGFTAADSLFFSNCHFGCGEAASVFAGPHSVSHHKSTLLIAGYFLFFNAGSGSNQSNHMFKKGPVHQGIHERGCKFASNAYIALPSREGAFSVVLGRHKSHHDTSSLPYSYLTEADGDTCVYPATNLLSAGLGRDIAKWPKRDRRPADAADVINYEEYNPYTGQKLLKAIGLCRELFGRSDADTIAWQRVRIKRVLLRRGLAIYSKALEALLGAILAAGGRGDRPVCPEWVDMAGMFAPSERIEGLCTDIAAGRFGGVDEVAKALRGISAEYGGDAFRWAVDALGQMLGREPSPEDIAEAVAKGEKAHDYLCGVREEDLSKEDTPGMRVGYGIDSLSDEVTEADFLAVREG